MVELAVVKEHEIDIVSKDTQTGNERCKNAGDEVVVRRRPNFQEVQGSYISRQGSSTSKAGVGLGSRGGRRGRGYNGRERPRSD